MRYTISDLEERAGIKARTIREYVRLGYINPPRGRGTGAEYDEEQLLQAISVVRMRAQGAGWLAVAESIPSWSLEELREYVKKTDPPTPEPPPPPVDPPVLDGEPVEPRAQLPRGSSTKTDLDASPRSARAELPDGPRWILAQLLPGMVLMVRDDAAPLVRRAAAEIVERYGA